MTVSPNDYDVTPDGVFLTRVKAGGTVRTYRVLCKFDTRPATVVIRHASGETPCCDGCQHFI